MALPIVELAGDVATQIPSPTTPEEPQVVAVTGIIVKHIPLPVIPLYELKLAAPLIPCSLNGLRDHLARHKHLYPAVYRRERMGRKVRLITAKEISSVRARMLKGPGLNNVLEIYPNLNTPLNT